MMEELNKKIGNRLRECLDNSSITQKQLAEDTGYTPQYISNIIVGKKRLSAEAARCISKILHVRVEYLLCEDDYMTNQHWWSKRHELFENQGNILESLVSLAGYRRVCEYIANFQELGLDRVVYGPFQEGENIEHRIPDYYDSKMDFYTVIEAPNGKRFACSSIDYSLLEHELLEFIHFRFKQLESKYWWEIEDGKKNGYVTKGSIIKVYEQKKVYDYPDILSNSLWVDHNKGMGSLAYVDWNKCAHGGRYDEKKKRWIYDNSEKFMPEEGED
ncbi:helix-turn-helix domain-containing protein [Lacrimispora brassicae]